MNNETKNVVLINGSPKTAGVSVSGTLASVLEQRLSSAGMSVKNICVRKNISADNEQDFRSIMTADALVLLFPLYFYCLPGLLIRYLQDFYEFFERHKGETAGGLNIYALANCGFPESSNNTEALGVIKSFSAHINAAYRFGISLGSGSMFGVQGAPFMKKPMAAIDAAFSVIADDVANGKEPLGDISIQVKMPKFLYFLGGNMAWNKMASINGLKKKDLYRKPYGA